MPRYVGTAGRVEVGGQVVAEVRSFEINIARDLKAAPVMGQTWTPHDIGQDVVTGTISCWTDPADTTGQGALLARTEVALTLYPQGVGSALPQYVLSAAYIGEISRSDESGEFGETEFTFGANSALDETPQV